MWLAKREATAGRYFLCFFSLRGTCLLPTELFCCPTEMKERAEMWLASERLRRMLFPLFLFFLWDLFVAH